jgi:hypothetical protein
MRMGKDHAVARGEARRRRENRAGARGSRHVLRRIAREPSLRLCGAAGITRARGFAKIPFFAPRAPRTRSRRDGFRCGAERMAGRFLDRSAVRRHPATSVASRHLALRMASMLNEHISQLKEKSQLQW